MLSVKLAQQNYSGLRVPFRSNFRNISNDITFGFIDIFAKFLVKEVFVTAMP
jgi:hypothetical protein